MSKTKGKTPESERQTADAAAQSGADEEAAHGAAEPSEAAEQVAAGEEAPGPEAEPEKSEAERIAALEEEVAQLRDQLLRALAETENVRRRSQREREEAVRYAAAPLIRDLLAVADNLARALESVPDGAAENDEALKTLLDGVKLTQRELQSAFERHDIVKLDPLGERLDPHRHEAMFELPDPDKPAGTVVQVVQSGYLLHDRLLRAARVGVAKGGPAANAAQRDSAANSATEAAAEDGEEEPPGPDGGAAKPGGAGDTSA